MHSTQFKNGDRISESHLISVSLLWITFLSVVFSIFVFLCLFKVSLKVLKKVSYKSKVELLNLHFGRNVRRFLFDVIHLVSLAILQRRILSDPNPCKISIRGITLGTFMSSTFFRGFRWTKYDVVKLYAKPLPLTDLYENENDNPITPLSETNKFKQKKDS